MDLIADAAPLRQFVDYLEHVGMDPRALGLDELGPAIQGLAASPLVSARLIVELMERAAEASGRDDLALEFVGWLNPRGFGPLSYIAPHCATYAQLYRLLERFVPIANRALAFDEAVEGDHVALVCRLHPALRARGSQFMEGNLALMVRNIRAMLGARWAPARIEMAHPPPVSNAAQSRFFRGPIEYGADRYAVTMTLEAFNRRVAEGEEEIVTFLVRHMAEREAAWPADLRGQVENLVAAQLAGAGADAGRVARLLAMSTSTLQRRLAEAGTSFGEILAEVRMQIVREHLARHEAPSLARLAHSLGFSEPSAACRFVKARFGASAGALLARGA
jgi:AraC-like DNA-binding protein